MKFRVRSQDAETQRWVRGGRVTRLFKAACLTTPSGASGWGHPVKVWVSREQTDVDAALAVLLEALGIDRAALAYCLDPATDLFVDLRADPA